MCWGEEVNCQFFSCHPLCIGFLSKKNCSETGEGIQKRFFFVLFYFGQNFAIFSFFVEGPCCPPPSCLKAKCLFGKKKKPAPHLTKHTSAMAVASRTALHTCHPLHKINPQQQSPARARPVALRGHCGARAPARRAGGVRAAGGGEYGVGAGQGGAEEPGWIARRGRPHQVVLACRLFFSSGAYPTGG